MAAKNTVEINIVELEVYKRLADLYKKENPNWQEKLYGPKHTKVENAKEKLKENKKEETNAKKTI